MDKQLRIEELREKYGERGVDTGIRLQGEHFLHSLHKFDEADSEWTEQWVSWIYDYMYNRKRLDDRTRVLVIIGELTASGDNTPNLANHMRTALSAGATPEEILEVILQASIYVGMPKAFQSLKVYRDLMNDLGLATFTDGPFDSTARDPR